MDYVRVAHNQRQLVVILNDMLQVADLSYEMYSVVWRLEFKWCIIPHYLPVTGEVKLNKRWDSKFSNFTIQKS